MAVYCRFFVAAAGDEITLRESASVLVSQQYYLFLPQGVQKGKIEGYLRASRTDSHACLHLYAVGVR